MPQVPQLEHFNKKTGPPKWSISFYIVSNKWVFQAHRKVRSTTGVVYAFFQCKEGVRLYSLLFLPLLFFFLWCFCICRYDNFFKFGDRDPKLTQNRKKCPICWVSHMFWIWEYRYSYGICFGTVYVLQNSTPNISTPNILSFFFLSTPVGLKSGIFYVGDHDYMYIYIYIYAPL